jgi:hypothetical protein
MTCGLWRLFALEPVAPGRHESHGREAQGKSQENTAGENSDDHGITSFLVLINHEVMANIILKINFSRASHPNIYFSWPGSAQGFIPPSTHGENDLNFGASGLGFIPDIAAVTPEDVPG